jgi:hypothetical protein
MAALHDAPTYFRNSVLAGNGIEGIPHAAIVALLNSELFAWFHWCRNRDARQQSFPQVKVSHLCALPRPPTGKQAAPSFRMLEREAREIERLSHALQSAWERWVPALAASLGLDPPRLRELSGHRVLLVPRTSQPDCTHLPTTFDDVRSALAKTQAAAWSGFPPLHSRGEGAGGEAPRPEALFAAYQAEANGLLQCRAAAYARLNDLVYRVYDVKARQIAEIQHALHLQHEENIAIE